jgi:hypothetical protein
MCNYFLLTLKNLLLVFYIKNIDLFMNYCYKLQHNN